MVAGRVVHLLRKAITVGLVLELQDQTLSFNVGLSAVQEQGAQDVLLSSDAPQRLAQGVPLGLRDSDRPLDSDSRGRSGGRGSGSDRGGRRRSFGNGGR